MPDRLPSVKRSDLPSQDQASFDSLASLAGHLFGPPDESPFIYKQQDDTFVGPFPLFLAAPDAGEHAMALYGKLAKIPGLPPDAKEVAILTVGAHYEAAYELYAHVNVAVKKVEMERGVVEAIARGEKPGELSEAGGVAYDVARYLVVTPGPLPAELWERGMKVFGKEGMVALLHYVGAYAYTCVLLNGMDCPVPKEG